MEKSKIIIKILLKNQKKKANLYPQKLKKKIKI
jgi:hypothetical protein